MPQDSWEIYTLRLVRVGVPFNWDAHLYCPPNKDVLVVALQVHKLDEATWKTVDVVPIDIADNSQVDSSVG